MRDALAQAGRRVAALFAPQQEWRPVYFVASPYKTATTTVGQALITLGAAKFQMRYKQGLLTDLRPTIREMNASVPKNADARDYIAANADALRDPFASVLPLLRSYDVFHDAPLGHSHIHPFILKALESQARFIWVNRPRKEWIASVRRWEQSHPDLYPRQWEWDTEPGARRKALRKFWDKRYRRFQRLAADFPGDCLEMDVADLASWEVLAKFCDRPAPPGRPEARNVSRS
ncbi:sulfotransferase [Sulfitobacter sp. D35]|uniref:sulfotransferase n=1 Tax=Sulfitobacter sp. D35 TaxID=3083252 RepID=UPI00296EF542|nr:sulfotransferase [Sulfitobacter sp. D35]MDW4498863.1 sulfotransferase [Sulfitobacter sp. D35]